MNVTQDWSSGSEERFRNGYLFLKKKKRGERQGFDGMDHNQQHNG